MMAASACTKRFAFALFLALMSTANIHSVFGAGVANRASGSAQLTANVLKDVQDIKKQIHSFWQRFGPDVKWGGFHGTLDIAGEVVIPTAKGLVQQTRHVWAFSTYHLHGYGTSAAANNPVARESGALRRAPKHHLLQQQQQLLTSQQMAKTAYDFVVKTMHDASNDMFHWNVTQQGALVQYNKVIYGQWFVLYSFSQYFTAFKDPQARDLALKCFKAVDKAWHSTRYGGFDEVTKNQIPPAPEAAKATIKKLASSSSSNSSRVVPGSKAGAAVKPAGRSSITGAGRRGAAQPQVRTLNVAMHGLEALTALHRITNDPDVLQRIKEYLHIICTRLERSNGLIFEEYVPVAGSNRKWKPAPRSVVNYGHNLESTWLVADTLDYLLSISAIEPSLAQQYRATVMSIGAAAVRDGYDQQHGGIFESGSPSDGPQRKVKVWWVQAEGMLALWKLHQYYDLNQGLQRDTAAAAHKGGSRSKYLHALAKTAKFVREHVTDGKEGGEQFWQVEPDGTFKPVPDNIDENTKGNRWKASYHNSRSVLFLEKWMQQ